MFAYSPLVSRKVGTNHDSCSPSTSLARDGYVWEPPAPPAVGISRDASRRDAPVAGGRCWHPAGMWRMRAREGELFSHRKREVDNHSMNELRSGKQQYNAEGFAVRHQYRDDPSPTRNCMGRHQYCPRVCGGAMDRETHLGPGMRRPESCPMISGEPQSNCATKFPFRLTIHDESIAAGLLAKALRRRLLTVQYLSFPIVHPNMHPQARSQCGVVTVLCSSGIIEPRASGSELRMASVDISNAFTCVQDLRKMKQFSVSLRPQSSISLTSSLPYNNARTAFRIRGVIAIGAWTPATRCHGLTGISCSFICRSELTGSCPTSCQSYVVVTLLNYNVCGMPLSALSCQPRVERTTSKSVSSNITVLILRRRNPRHPTVDSGRSESFVRRQYAPDLPSITATVARFLLHLAAANLNVNRVYFNVHGLPSSVSGLRATHSPRAHSSNPWLRALCYASGASRRSHPLRLQDRTERRSPAYLGHTPDTLMVAGSTRKLLIAAVYGRARPCQWTGGDRCYPSGRSSQVTDESGYPLVGETRSYVVFERLREECMWQGLTGGPRAVVARVIVRLARTNVSLPSD
ncbi:uncharacterized protein C8Q71DRAFT_851112 [Rhodofomes roseus]|uniref:Reverse transcriptase domain-containing protein n=1 Tax=Rhodofomes roseus TaxID=34475 RepID=A0ABQ8K2A1_9APHY|nr:uncharacterized protein C8Q71DRAFT_851112 [Rhodofomes roseus]KAH9830823.1 hypothetical protein C8Q71DRAFT_851112 [Rhodofomes roseus]